MSRILFLPSIYNQQSQPSGQSPFESVRNEIFVRIKNHSQQQRMAMKRHSLLDEAAQNKAEEMARLNYFSHVSPDGVSANENIRQTGYLVPYPKKGKDNNGESLYKGHNGEAIQSPIDLWYSSPGHRIHVFALDKFYVKQECIGIGVAEDNQEIRYIVFISMPCY